MPTLKKTIVRASMMTCCAASLLAASSAHSQSDFSDDDRRAYAEAVIDRILDGEANPRVVAEVFELAPMPEVFTDRFGPVGEASIVRVGPRPRSFDLANVFRNPAFPLEALADDERPNPTSRPMRISRRQPIFISSADVGTWTQLPDGGRLWTFEAISPNARSLRLCIDPFNPPRGAELITWNAADESETYGPVTRSRSRDNLPYWTPTVYSNHTRLEYYLPPGVQGEHHLTITGALLGFPMDDGGDGGLAGWDSCQVDVTCESAWDTDALSVAHIQFVSGGSGFICSGAMVNRLPAFDATPYFWTASHCINTEAEANSIEVYWLFQSSTCNGSWPSLNSVPRTDGSTVLANASDPDYTLLGLTPDDIPGGLVWAGWATGNPANPQAATEIHHPLGNPKSISHGNFEGPDNSCGSPINQTIRFDLNNGGQAGGSSGAPVFTDSDHRIRATVSCSATDLCDPDENAWEGRLNLAYPTFAPFMDAASTVYVNIAWGGSESGTIANPWDEVVEGYFGVPGGGTIIFSAGTYPQYSFTGSKACTLGTSGGSVLFQ